jgi:hypothetical protein
MSQAVRITDPGVGWDVLQAAAAGGPEAWDQIVDAYAGLVWARLRRRGLTGPQAASVNLLIWLRLSDRLALLSPEAIGGYLEETAEREGTKVVRLSMIAHGVA